MKQQPNGATGGGGQKTKMPLKLSGRKGNQTNGIPFAVYVMPRSCCGLVALFRVGLRQRWFSKDYRLKINSYVVVLRFSVILILCILCRLIPL